ncbi:helix-turn-helix domain-containing protein, partial [Streptomyces sp. NPDC057273]
MWSGTPVTVRLGDLDKMCAALSRTVGDLLQAEPLAASAGEGGVRPRPWASRSPEAVSCGRRRVDRAVHAHCLELTDEGTICPGTVAALTCWIRARPCWIRARRRQGGARFRRGADSAADGCGCNLDGAPHFFSRRDRRSTPAIPWGVSARTPSERNQHGPVLHRRGMHVLEEAWTCWSGTTWGRPNLGIRPRVGSARMPCILRWPVLRIGGRFLNDHGRGWRSERRPKSASGPRTGLPGRDHDRDGAASLGKQWSHLADRMFCPSRSDWLQAEFVEHGLDFGVRVAVGAVVGVEDA